ncbi:MAG: class I SAM-dependent methyltransferase [Pseudomonadota bacterium]
MNCRHCGSSLDVTLIDLGSSPPSNAYLSPDTLCKPEKWFPLRVLVCTQCWLVQTEDFTEADDLFDENYSYFSGFSESWLKHSERYVESTIKRFDLNHESHVVEVAANDGYLLQYVKAAGIPCTGVEPTASTATAARGKGIPIIESFFGCELVEKMLEDNLPADLMVANNVLAHVPDINDFVSGFKRLLKPDGVATFEFPQLLQLMDKTQFDTIYHEHFSYLSLTSVFNIFNTNGLEIFDVETLPTHGGSLRVYAQINGEGKQGVSNVVDRQLQLELEAGITDPSFYTGFQSRAEAIKDDLLSFLLEAKAANKTVAAYGAAAKGNTLLNFAGIRSDMIQFVVDRNPNKQGKFLPGSRIPIVSDKRLREFKPDYVILLPWNLMQELTEQLAYVREWGASFVTPIPKLTIS